MNLGKSIRLCRKYSELTQTELAKKADISVSYLSLLEKGKRDPNISTLNKLADAIGIPLKLLIFIGVEKKSLNKREKLLAEQITAYALQVLSEK